MSFILHPEEGERVQIRSSSCTFKATGSHTHGHVGLFEFTMEPNTSGASLHIHKRMTEMFYVVEGEVELQLETETIKALPGSFMLVPENTPHGFSNPSPQQSKLLIIFCPADHREDYFRGLAELTKNGHQPSQEELIDLMHRFDQYLPDEEGK